MKLPDRQRAFVPAGKLKGYLLSPAHPVGRQKAAYFSGLGFSLDEPEVLERELLRVAGEGAVADEPPRLITAYRGRGRDIDQGATDDS